MIVDMWRFMNSEFPSLETSLRTANIESESSLIDLFRSTGTFLERSWNSRGEVRDSSKMGRGTEKEWKWKKVKETEEIERERVKVKEREKLKDGEREHRRPIKVLGKTGNSHSVFDGFPNLSALSRLILSHSYILTSSNDTLRNPARPELGPNDEWNEWKITEELWWQRFSQESWFCEVLQIL